MDKKVIINESPHPAVPVNDKPYAVRLFGAAARTRPNAIQELGRNQHTIRCLVAAIWWLHEWMD
jgi:hypothetical protein